MSRNDRGSFCSFYEKIGACRHGDKCSRKHVKPKISRTILCQNFYRNPQDEDSNLSRNDIETKFNEFFEDIFIECCKQGGIVENLMVSENENDHLKGNVYIKLASEKMAEKVLRNFNSRWYNNRPINCEFSPVRDFSQSCCRQHATNTCQRGGMCNFLHAKSPKNGLFEELMKSQAVHLESEAAKL